MFIESGTDLIYSYLKTSNRCPRRLLVHGPRDPCVYYYFPAICSEFMLILLLHVNSKRLYLLG